MSDIQLMYKLGFCERLARLGISPSELEAAIDKQASGVAGRIVGGAGHVLGGALHAGTTGALLLGSLLVGAPFLAGYGGGYLSGKATRFSNSDVEAIKKKQSIENYERAISQLRMLSENQGNKDRRRPEAEVLHV